MPGRRFSDLSEADLVEAYIDNVRRWEEAERISAQNRLMDIRREIEAELLARDDSLRAVRALLDHPDPRVCHTAAYMFRMRDHDAFERTMHALAEFDDGIGRKARSSLEWDAHFQKFGYPELEAAKPEERPPLPPAQSWQADNPPPVAMTVADIEAVLRDSLTKKTVNRLLKLMRPALGLWPQRVPSDFDPAGSRLGGLPYMPKGSDWPRIEDEPLLFVGQINIADIAGLPGTEALPKSGLMAFFAEYDAAMGCSSAGDCSVFHWPNAEELAPASEPDHLPRILSEAALAFRPITDLPDPHSCVLAGFFTDDAERQCYAALCDEIRNHGIPADLHQACSFGKLLGWPRLVQPHDLDVFEYGASGRGWRLLLQVEDYANGETSEAWGPGGSIYFMVREKPLRKMHIDKCELMVQVT